MKVLSFLTCDDVRKEVDGKTTLVGLYDGLRIPAENFKQSEPPVIRVAGLLRLLFETGDVIPTRVEIALRFNDDLLAKAESVLQVVIPARTINLVLPMSLLPVPSPGTLTFEFAFFTDEGKVGETLHFASSIDAVEQLTPQH